VLGELAGRGLDAAPGLPHLREGPGQSADVDASLLRLDLTDDDLADEVEQRVQLVGADADRLLFLDLDGVVALGAQRLAVRGLRRVGVARRIRVSRAVLVRCLCCVGLVGRRTRGGRSGGRIRLARRDGRKARVEAFDVDVGRKRLPGALAQEDDHVERLEERVRHLGHVRHLPVSHLDHDVLEAVRDVRDLHQPDHA
jgi:hypothetical protein